jgi:two-component system nitrate/nitrite response regulator NarL
MLEDSPQQSVIMLTLSEEADDLLKALQLGAKGYLLKNSNVDYLVNAIRLVAQGGTAIQPEMTSTLVAGLRQNKKEETEEKEIPNQGRGYKDYFKSIEDNVNKLKDALEDGWKL